MGTMSEQPVSRVLLVDHELSDRLSAGHVEVRRITMGPGSLTGPHEHNGPVFGVIQSGSVRFQVEDGPTVTLRAGEVFYEPAETRISRFDATEEGVEFLAWFPLPTGQAGAMTPLP